MSLIEDLTTFHMGENLRMKMQLPNAAVSYDELRLKSVLELDFGMDQVDQLITSLEAFKKSHEINRYKLKPEYRNIYGMAIEESYLNNCKARLSLSTGLDAGSFQTLFTEAEFNKLITPDHELYGKLEKDGEYYGND